MSEINAAFGLLQLKYIDEVITRRQAIDTFYRTELTNIDGIKCLALLSETKYNYSYFPILIEKNYHLSRDELYQILKDKGIYARRYFYPLISDMTMYQHLPSAADFNLPIAKMISEKVLCLPIYPDLLIEHQENIVSIIKKGQ
jgi:dTDP-4-amino-4,6-dideoxygalactose transaminase